MAGSFRHVTKDDGSLRKPSSILQMLDAPYSGDVAECVTEMYGMIWWLATQIANEQSGAQADPALYVEAARTEYETGLKESPTKRFAKE